MKSPCCNKEMLTYSANTYPYERGYKCVCCGLELSDLQIARGALDEKENLGLDVNAERNKSEKINYN